MKDLPKIDRHTALLIIDVQKGFINQETKNLPHLIEKLQQNYSITIATKFVNYPESPIVKWLGFEKCMENTQDVELAFQPISRTYILTKSTYSCVNNEFKNVIKNNKVHNIHIVGMDTNMCVSQSAIDIFETGLYRPLILANYCASHSGLEFHNMALQILEKAVGREQIWTE